MKAVVIYKSKSGFVKKYAEWIAEELSADIFDVSKAGANMLENYDTVIYGGSLHAVGINGVKFITKNLDKLKDKKVAIFATGASPAEERAINHVKSENFTEEQQKYFRFFYLRGGFDYSKLQPFDKFLMTLMKHKLKKKKESELSRDEKGMLEGFDKPVDFTSKENIAELITYVRS